MLELLVRIEKILARTGKLNAVLRYHDLTVDVSKRTVQKAGEPIKLQPLEFDLLVKLLRFKNCTLTRERLLNEIWGFDFVGGTRTVDIHVAHLRKKLGPDLNIVAVMKLGYRLED
jgi:DNA-binding response OmpR family regulator